MSGSGTRSGLRPFRPVSFGRFTLLAPLAAGGMGEIFLARSTFQGGLDKLCVIKKVLPQLAEDPEFVGRFLDEARTLVALQHGSIAQVYDTGSFDGDYWIALEFVDGKDLRRLMQRVRANGGRLPVVLSLYIALRVLEALAYAHRKKDESGVDLGLVHRDVSPQNILVSYEGEVKVIDFGLAKSKLSLGLSQPQAVLGKLYYMPPEQARGDPVDRRSDLYAVGVVLYELLSGQNPFEDAAQDQLFSRICAPRIQPVQELEPTLPQGIADALAKALAPNPEARFRTAEQMRAALSACLSELAPDVGPEQLATYVVTLFAEEHQREREVLARFALRSAGEGETFGDAAPGASHDETRPVEDPRPPATEPGPAPLQDEAPIAPQFTSPTSRFADPLSPVRADDVSPTHLVAPTLRGSGLPDLPWDRRASGTGALASATAAPPVDGPVIRPWYEVPTEEDRIHRLRIAQERRPGEVRKSGEKRETSAAALPSAPLQRGGAPSSTEPPPRTEEGARTKQPLAEGSPPQTQDGSAQTQSARQPPAEGAALQGHAAVHPPEGAQREGADAREARRDRRAIALPIFALLVLGAGTAYWLARPPAIDIDEAQVPPVVEEPIPAAVEPAPEAPLEVRQEEAPPTPEPLVEEPVDEPPIDPPVSVAPPTTPRTKPVEPPPTATPTTPAVAAVPPTERVEDAIANPTPKPAAPTIDRRQELIRRREALRRSFSSLVAEHGAGQIGSIVIELERAVGSSFDRFIDAPEQYDSLERQLGELEQILDERRRAFQ